MDWRARSANSNTSSSLYIGSENPDPLQRLASVRATAYASFGGHKIGSHAILQTLTRVGDDVQAAATRTAHETLNVVQDAYSCTLSAIQEIQHTLSRHLGSC